ncbi:MAG TPA: NUDIX domain-containing protein [Anaerolineales bacterium]|jgi:8-oxo-dGTP diphosphatase|nr:NUDIX domain-containing protein [Anaerolineales bacterium]HQX16651.1 NUDIX domain-containing protein [Anaerolineales bacterium]
MRIRAGVVLIEDNKVALIERHRAGLDYFVFPGGGVDEGETVEKAAVREAREELGVEVVIKQKVAEIHIETSRQVYFLAERVAGEFGTGTGEEFIDSDPNDPSEGIYVPIWMPIGEMSEHGNVYPAELVEVVVRSMREGWGV